MPEPRLCCPALVCAPPLADEHQVGLRWSAGMPKQGGGTGGGAFPHQVPAKHLLLLEHTPLGQTSTRLGCTRLRSAWVQQGGGLAGLTGVPGDTRVTALPILMALVPGAGWQEQRHHAAPGLPLLRSLLEH